MSTLFDVTATPVPSNVLYDNLTKQLVSAFQTVAIAPLAPIRALNVLDPITPRFRFANTVTDTDPVAAPFEGVVDDTTNPSTERDRINVPACFPYGAPAADATTASFVVTADGGVLVVSEESAVHSVAIAPVPNSRAHIDFGAATPIPAPNIVTEIDPVAGMLNTPADVTVTVSVVILSVESAPVCFSTDTTTLSESRGRTGTLDIAAESDTHTVAIDPTVPTRLPIENMFTDP